MSVLVQQGTIVGVGRDLAVPNDAVVIDARGKHISPGIIDCHSHIATDGGINEQTQTITAEVRMGDYIDCNDVQIYRQLAGGVTCANMLHGSANTIGGQNQVIKIRWGLLPEELKFPRRRMESSSPSARTSSRATGATAAATLKREWAWSRSCATPSMRPRLSASVGQWRETPAGMPPRTDLELDALVEVVFGSG